MKKSINNRVTRGFASVIAPIMLVLLVFATGCAGSGAGTETGAGTADSSKIADSDPIVIGSKNFSENLIVAEVYALALEDAGYTVERNFALNTDVLHTALINDEIDLYPEYTGTAYLNILKLEPSFDRDEVYNTVKEQYAERFNLNVLETSDVNDTACFILTNERAEELGIRSFADLQKKADQIVRATFLSSGEGSRQEWAEYEKIYGEFKFKDVKSIDPALSYTALDSGEVDLASGLTTAPELFSGKYHILEENVPTYIPYYLVPIVRRAVTDEHPDVADILNGISTRLNNEIIIGLITQTDVDKIEYEDVAKEYFDVNVKR